VERPAETSAAGVGAPRATQAGRIRRASATQGDSDAQPLRMYGVCGDTGTPTTPARGVGLVACDGSLGFLTMRALAQNERMTGLMVWSKDNVGFLLTF
jgi:hypothetical protein